jgi:hypothetical protein
MKALQFRAANNLMRLTLLAACSAATPVLAQSQPQETPPASPMVKPPAAASGAASATDPDNMPVRKPAQPTHDSMIRSEPASAATAK